MQVPTDAPLTISNFIQVHLAVNLDPVHGIREVDEIACDVGASRPVFVKVVPTLHHVVEMVVVLGDVAEIACLERLKAHFNRQERHPIGVSLCGQVVDFDRVQAGDVLRHRHWHRLIVELHADKVDVIILLLCSIAARKKPRAPLLGRENFILLQLINSLEALLKSLVNLGKHDVLVLLLRGNLVVLAQQNVDRMASVLKA